MVTAVRSLGLQGISGYEVTVECFLSGGLPAFDIVGLGDTAVKESRERVRASNRKKLAIQSKKMILKDGFIQPERLSLVTLDRPPHCPMGSRRGDPAADAAPLNTKNVINGEG